MLMRIPKAVGSSNSMSSSNVGTLSTSHVSAVADIATGVNSNINNLLTANGDQSKHCDNAENNNDLDSQSDSNSSANSSTEVDSSGSQALKQVWPSCWSMEQQNYFKTTYCWLYPKAGSIGCSICNEVHAIAGPHREDGMRANLAQEWVNGSVHGTGNTKQAVLKCLRKKLLNMQIQKAIMRHWL